MNREQRYKTHSYHVSNWLNESSQTLSSDELLNFFEFALNRVNKVAGMSLSLVTLDAVLDRILYNSSEQYPVLRPIKVKNSMFDFTYIDSETAKNSENELRDAFHYLITEYLFIIGKLTGEQLTPTLYNELKKTFANCMTARSREIDLRQQSDSN